MRVKRVKVSVDDLIEAINTYPAVAEVRTFEDGTVDRIRITTHDGRDIAISVSSVYEIVKEAE